MRVIALFFLIFVSSCGALKDTKVEEFKNCYTKEKLVLLEEAVSILDSLVYKDKTLSIKENYILLANNALENAEYIHLSDSNTQRIKDLLSKSEFVSAYGSVKYHPSSSYFSCLRSLKGDENVQLYLENIEFAGDHLGYALALTHFLALEGVNYIDDESTIFFALRVELLLGLVQVMDSQKL